MVDVDRRLSGLKPAHAAGLRRLHARAASASASDSGTALSLRSIAENVLMHLHSSGTTLQPGVTDEEFAISEAEFGFVFPPDLRAVFSSGLPTGPAFPDWRCCPGDPARLVLRASFELPAASVSLQVVRNGLWPRSWGPKPYDPAHVLMISRARLKRAPALVPIANGYYIPSRPCLAGNPVFYLDKDRVVQCGKDLSDLFNRVSRHGKFASYRIREESLELANQSGYTRNSLDNSGRQPRWIEFWSDVAAADEQRRKSASSSSWTSSPERFFEIQPTPRTRHWVNEYIEEIASILKDGKWSEQDTREMTMVPASDFFREGGIVALDGRMVLDMLLLKVNKFAEMMRNAGWSTDDVSNAFEPGLRPENKQNSIRRLPPRLEERFEKLAEWVSR